MRRQLVWAALVASSACGEAGSGGNGEADAATSTGSPMSTTEAEDAGEDDSTSDAADSTSVEPTSTSGDATDSGAADATTGTDGQGESSTGQDACADVVCGPGMGCDDGECRELTWSATHDTPSALDDEARDVAIDVDDAVIVVGFETRTDVGQGRNAWIRKFNRFGDEVWTVTYGDDDAMFDRAMSVATDADRNVYVFGQSTPNTSPLTLWVRKYDADGNELVVWIAEPGATEQEARAIEIDGEGNVFVAAEVRVPGGQPDIWVAKLDPQFNVLWEDLAVGGANEDLQVYGIAIDDDGYAHAVGSLANTSLNSEHAWRRRYAPDGTIEWTYDEGVIQSPPLDTRAIGAVALPDGTVALGAQRDVTLPYIGIFTATTGFWVNFQDSENEEVNLTVNDLALSPDGAMVLAGTAGNLGGSFDMWIRGFDPLLSETWEWRFDDGAGGRDDARAVEFDSEGYIIAVGYGVTEPGGDRNGLVVKFVPPE
ncbi:MAG: hypothetical protein AAF721_13515 [Myxococcota bacterium]